MSKRRPNIKANPLPPGVLPGLRVEPRFRGKNGRYCKPHLGVYFELTPPGKRKPIVGEIPKEYRRTIKGRVQYLGKVLGDYSHKRLAKEIKQRERQVVRQSKRAKEKERELKKRVKAKDPRAVRELKKRAALEEQMNERQLVTLEKLGAEKLSPTSPRAGQLRAIESREKTHWDVIGRNLDEKLQDKIRQDRQDGRSGQARATGIKDFQGYRMGISKLHVDFAEGEQVPVFPFNVRGVASAMKEFFMQKAEKFVDEKRGVSEEAYIIRIKTLNSIDGQKAQEQGIGIPRFRMPRRLNPGDVPFLRKSYPGLTDAEILRHIQKQALETQFDRLVKYFVDRYEDYLGRRVVSSMAVTGFSMEVVDGIVGKVKEG